MYSPGPNPVGGCAWREVDTALLDDGGARDAGVEVPHHFEASPEHGLLRLGLVLPVWALLRKAAKVPEEPRIAGRRVGIEEAAHSGERGAVRIRM